MNRFLMQFTSNILLLFLISQVIAQENIDVGLSPEKSVTQYNCDYWDIDNGMASNTVVDNLLSHDGYMWIATYDGLVKFDGMEFQFYNERNHREFRKNGVLSLFEDSDSTLWIGSNGGGLIRLKDEKVKVFAGDTLRQSNIITDIAKDKTGNLWLATRKGVVKFVNDRFVYDENLKPLSKSIILSILIDSKERVWIGTLADGLFKFENNSLSHYDVSDGLDDNSARTLFEDADGKIWIGTNIGLNYYYNHKINHLDIPTDGQGFFINDIIQDTYKTLWVATDIGLIKINGETIEILNQENGLRDNNIQSLEFDFEGSLWMGTYRTGIARLKDGKFKNYGVIEGLANNIVNVVYQEDDRIWVGTDYGLSILEDGIVSSFSMGSGYQQNRIRDIIKDRQGKIWICTYNGLVEFKNGQVVRHYNVADGLSSEKTRVLAQDKNDRIWVGTARGLNVFSNGKFITYDQEDGLRNEFIMSVSEDSHGVIWVGTDGGGLHQFDGEKFVSFGEKDGLASNVVFQIVEDQLGNLWIGTNGGLSRYDGKEFKSIDFQNGLYSNSIFDIVIDPNNECWLMTNKGVQKISLAALNEVADGKKAAIEQVETYNRSEGMRSSVITGASLAELGKNGEILVPTFKGLTIIEPNQIKVNNVQPPVKIVEFKLNNESLDLRSSIILPPGKESIELTYTGLSLYAPDEVTFEYQLIGFDNEWQKADTRRSAFYTNLPPGDYEFKVKAANNDGVWNDDGSSLFFTKEAFFYQTKAFPFTVFLALLLIGVTLYRIRTNQLRKQNIQLQTQVSERTKDIQMQNHEIREQKEELKRLNTIKDKLFSIISHDLRGPVNSFGSILGLLKSDNITVDEAKALSSNLEMDLGRLKNFLENLLNWAKTQMQGIKANPVLINLHEIVESNRELFKADIAKKQITLQNNVCTDAQVLADLNMTKLVVRNLINNAIKFTDAGGLITVSTKDQSQFLEINITDNGTGMSPELIEKLFDKEFNYSRIGTSKEDGSGIGLILCKEFVEENGGKIWAESVMGEGSTFKFWLKKG